MKKILMQALALLLLFIAAPELSAKDRYIEKIIAEGQTNPQVADHLDILTGRFGGRLIGSAAYDDAANWMLHKYG